jgi:hypothetical protein
MFLPVLPTLVQNFKTPVKSLQSDAEGLPDAVKQPFQQNVPRWGTLNKQLSDIL